MPIHPEKSRISSTISKLAQAQYDPTDSIESELASPIPSQRSRSRSMLHQYSDSHPFLAPAKGNQTPSSRSFPVYGPSHMVDTTLLQKHSNSIRSVDDDSQDNEDDEDGLIPDTLSSLPTSSIKKNGMKPKWRRLCEMLIKAMCIGAIVFFLYTNIKVVKYSIIKVLYFVQTIDPLLGSLLLTVSIIVQALLLLPCLPFTLAAGYMYGIWYGTLVVQVASSASAVIGFIVSRYLLYSYISKRFLAPPSTEQPHPDGELSPPQTNIWSAIDRAIVDDSFKITFLLRFSPLHPFGVFNYLFGITSISTYNYCVATFVAIFPTTVLEVYMGTALRSFSSIFGGTTGSAVNPRDSAAGAIKATDYSSPEKIMLYCGVIISLFVTAYLTIYIKAKLEEQLRPYQTIPTHDESVDIPESPQDSPRSSHSYHAHSPFELDAPNDSSPAGPLGLTHKNKNSASVTLDEYNDQLPFRYYEPMYTSLSSTQGDAPSGSLVRPTFQSTIFNGEPTPSNGSIVILNNPSIQMNNYITITSPPQIPLDRGRIRPQQYELNPPQTGGAHPQWSLNMTR